MSKYDLRRIGHANGNPTTWPYASTMTLNFHDFKNRITPSFGAQMLKKGSFTIQEQNQLLKMALPKLQIKNRRVLE